MAEPFPEELLVAVPTGGRVGWWSMQSGPPRVMTELRFAVRPARSVGVMRELSLCLTLEGLQLLVARVTAAAGMATELAERMADRPAERREPDDPNT